MAVKQCLPSAQGTRHSQRKDPEAVYTKASGFEKYPFLSEGHRSGKHNLTIKVTYYLTKTLLQLVIN
jgi:hypothetical protein